MKLCNKVNEITGYMKEAGIDALCIGANSDMEYLTGLTPLSDERFKALVILGDGRHFSICPELYYEETRQVLGEDAPILVWSDAEGFLKAIDEANRLYGLEGANIGVNEEIRAVDIIDMQRTVNVSFVNGSGIMEKVRQIKDEDEGKRLKKAALIADQVAEEIVGFIRPGLTEGDIRKKIEELFMEKGADGLAFTPIVASGPNSSKPHYNDDRRVIEERDIIVLDFGGRHGGYCSDMSRTIFIGKPTREQEEIYNIVLSANTEAEGYARQGVTAGDVDRKARDVIREAGYGQYFINRTGHGIGMAVHEAPYIKEGSGTVLENGMAFSVEPGIYLPGRFGMRIEDIVLVENGEGRVLNRFTKEMICL